jgi:predicted nucleic acid-binding protein
VSLLENERRFNSIIENDNKFTPRQLVLLAHAFHVSPEAVCRQLERIELLPKGTYESMRERGFNAVVVRGIIGEPAPAARQLPVPPKLAQLASSAYRRALVSEGQLARMLSLDRVEVREILDIFGGRWMKSKFPSIESQSIPLVVDASAVINLLGTGMPVPLLRNLGMRVLIAAEAYGEVRGHPIQGELIESIVSERLIEQVELGNQGRGVFLQLVASDLTGGLDDGEASTIAAALEHSKDAVVVVDEKKAARLLSERWPERRCISTVTLLALPRVRTGRSDQAFADAVFSALKNARMRVPADGLEWVLG